MHLARFRRLCVLPAFLLWPLVVTLVVLADLDEAWRPDEYVFRIGDFETRLRFPVCKLIEKLDGDWREDQSLPVQIARAQIEALRTASDPEGRYRAKWRLVRNLYDLGYNAEELREIFRLIDWMMALREDLNQKFEQELIALEESLNMPYVTSVERIAEARGEAMRRSERRREFDRRPACRTLWPASGRHRATHPRVADATIAGIGQSRL